MIRRARRGRGGAGFRGDGRADTEPRHPRAPFRYPAV